MRYELFTRAFPAPGAGMEDDLFAGVALADAG
jgi:hypothetical protein